MFYKKLKLIQSVVCMGYVFQTGLFYFRSGNTVIETRFFNVDLLVMTSSVRLFYDDMTMLNACPDN